MRKLILSTLSILALLIHPLSLSAQNTFSLSLDGDDTASFPDFDDDGTVGVSDFLIFTRVFGSSQGDGKYEARYDLDADGKIGLFDFFIFVQHFGKKVPPSLVSSQQIYNDNVFVLPLTEDLVAAEYGMADLSVRFYEYFSDEFDFLIFLPSVLNTQIPDYTFSAFFDGSPSNDVKGIGLSSYFSSIYGSAGKLQGVIYFRTAFNRWNDGSSDYSNISFSDSFVLRERSLLIGDVLLHELMHGWANYIVPSISWGHWGLSSGHGILGGFDIATLVKHENGRYSAQSKTWPGFYGSGGQPPYSPIELYLAGLIPPEEVPDLWVAEDGEFFLSDDFSY